MKSPGKSRYGRVSPPPLKRQRRAPASTTTSDEQSAGTSAPTPGALRIFSWNINGIAPFVQDYFQKSIDTFFTPPSVAGKKRRRGAGDNDSDDDVTTDSENDKSKGSARIDNPATGGKASFRLALQRYRWPHILFLQEVKIKPGDTKTMAAVSATINDVSESSRAAGGWTNVHNNNNNEADTENNKSCGALLEDGGPEYEVRFSLPADPHNAKGFGGRVYGVAAVIRKDFMNQHVQAIREVPWDREGRVQIVETREVSFPMTTNSATTSPAPDHKKLSIETTDRRSVQFDTKLAFINIYAVNGTTNPYRNTYTGSDAGTRHDRKLAVHAELLRETHVLQRRGFQVIIAGDLNVARNELDGYPSLRTWPHQHVLNRIDFNTKFFTRQPIKNISSRATYPRSDGAAMQEEFIQGFDGIDTFRHLHGSERRYSYYPRGRPWGSSCDRVDLIITSRTLSDSIVAAGICDSPRDRGPSDHCPIWAEIGRYSNGDDSRS